MTKSCIVCILRTFTRRIAYALFVVAIFPSFAHTASFLSEKSTTFGSWTTHLFRNTNGNRLFCAIENRNSGTDLRVNRYLRDNDTFLEVFNQNWDIGEGNVSLILSFQVGDELYNANLEGQAWNDSYTYDFRGEVNYKIILELISNASKIVVFGPNQSEIARFDGQGGKKAVDAYQTCLGR